MEPTLLDGDWLLVDPLAFRERSPRPGELVVAAGEPWLVKRAALVADDDTLKLRGDHPTHGDEQLQVAVVDINGRPWFRYWPLRRFGRVR